MSIEYKKKYLVEQICLVHCPVNVFIFSSVLGFFTFCILILGSNYELEYNWRIFKDFDHSMLTKICIYFSTMYNNDDLTN